MQKTTFVIDMDTGASYCVSRELQEMPSIGDRITVPDYPSLKGVDIQVVSRAWRTKEDAAGSSRSDWVIYCRGRVS